MIKHIIITAVMLLTTTVAVAQFKITGTVVDSAGAPLPMANVIAYQQDKNLGAFGITNQNGKYQLNGLKKDSTYTLKVSFLGLKPMEEKVENLQADLVKNFIMKAGADELDAVNITYQMPVSIKGDTIVYDADSFTNGTEDKLGDVLKKLPGVEVNEDGDIQVEGQTVEKVQVEGKDFFEGDSRLATKNIPADAVSKVEVLKNYNNQRQLKGLGNDQDRIVINIKLKEGKKKFWFGEATVGAGYGGDAERYLIQPKAFYYSEDFSINILTDFNNLGTPAFTGRDYFRFVGFRRFDTRQNNSSINVDAASTFSPFATNRALSIDSKFAAANASWKVNDKLDMSGFAIFSSSDTRSRIARNNLFSSGLIEDSNTEGFERNQNALFKAGADYNPNSNLTINYDGRFNISEQQQLSQLTSDRPERIDGTFQQITEDIDELNEQRPVVFNQSLNMYYTAGEDHIFALESRYLNQEEDPLYNAVRDIRGIDAPDEPEPFNGALSLDPSNAYNINQQNLVFTNKLDAKLDYWYVINKKSNINFTLGSEFTSQNYDSNIFQIRDDSTRNDLLSADTRNSNVQFNFNDVFLGIHYKVIFGKFTVTPGVTAHSFRTQDIQLGAENVIETQRVMPDLTVRYDFRSSESLNFNYRQNVTFNDINSYALGLVFNNYNSLRSGNNQLEGAINDVVSLRYNNFNMFNYTFIGANVRYTRQREAIQSQVRLQGINQVSSPINFNLPNETLSGGANYGREVANIQLGVNTNLNWSRNNNRINDVDQESISFNQNYGATARSNFEKGLNFDLGYNLNFNDSDNAGFENNSTTNTYSLGIDWQLGKRWLLRADYNYNDFKASTGAENNFEFLNASLRYQKPDSRWEYSINANNLLNTEVNVQNNVGQISTSTTQTFVLPRYIYFEMRFDL
jgi:hypothetical protein